MGGASPTALDRTLDMADGAGERVARAAKSGTETVGNVGNVGGFDDAGVEVTEVGRDGGGGRSSSSSVNSWSW
jgi:hypothetical protein